MRAGRGTGGGRAGTLVDGTVATTVTMSSSSTATGAGLPGR